MMLIWLSLENGNVNPVPRIYVRGFETLHLQGVWNNHPRAYVRDVLSFDLPVRPIRQAHGPEVLEGQAQGPEVLEGEALDGWFGVKPV